jgi:sulfur carrier protein ThiS
MRATLRVSGEGCKTVEFNDGDTVSDVLDSSNVSTENKVVRVNGALAKNPDDIPAMDGMTVDVTTAAKAA